MTTAQPNFVLAYALEERQRTLHRDESPPVELGFRRDDRKGSSHELRKGQTLAIDVPRGRMIHLRVDAGMAWASSETSPADDIIEAGTCWIAGSGRAVVTALREETEVSWSIH